MRVSELTDADVLNFLHAEEAEDDISPSALLAAAKAYVRGETALSDEEIDEHEDLTIAVLVLCADMHEQRLMTNDGKYGGAPNRTVDTIIGLHRRNLV